MKKKLEIHHLNLLDALFIHKNISQAAESMNISQQAVSSKLQTIRERLGDPLFVREGHGMVATPYAQSIQAHVINILEQVNEFPLPDNTKFNSASRVIVISATDYTQYVIVKYLANALRQEAPNIQLIVDNIEVASLTKKMNQGEIDLAFTSSGYVPEGLISEPLFTEQYVCIAAENSNIASSINIEALAQQDFIVTNPGTANLTGSADIWFQKLGLVRNTVTSTPSFFMTLEFIKSSNMIGFIPSRFLPYQGVREIQISKKPPGYEVVAAYHPRAKHDPLLNWLIGQAKLIT